MQGSSFLFILLATTTACTSIPRQSALASGYHGSCALSTIRGITIDYAWAKQAVRDFAQQQGYPYSILYVETHAGSPQSSIICIRLVQQAESQFTYYSYRNQQVKILAVTNPVLGQLLAGVRQGHFMGMCDNYASESAEGILLVKRDSTVIFSLAVSLHEREGFTGTDKERVAAALKLIRHVVNREN